MKKIYIIFLLCVLSLSAMAWTDGETFSGSDGLKYQVISATKYTVRTCGVADESKAVVDGTVTIPATIVDPANTSKTFTVTNVQFYGNSGKLPSSVTKLVLSEGITTLESLWQSYSVEEVVIPASLTNYSHSTAYTIRKFTIDPDNQKFTFIYEDQTRDAEAGFLASKDGKTYYYHVIPSTNIYGDEGRITIPNTVETIGTQVFREAIQTGSSFKSYIKIIHLGSGVKSYGTYNIPDALTAFEVEDGNTVFGAYDGALYKWDSTKETYLLTAFSPQKTGTFKVWNECTILSSLCLQNAKITSIDLNKVKTVEYNAWRFANLQKVIIGPDLEYFRNSQIGSQFKTFEFEADADKTAEEKKNSTNHTNFKLVDGALLSSDGTILVAMPAGLHNGETYTIPDGVTRLEDYSFHYSYIKQLISNAELREIGTREVFFYSKFETADFSASTNLTNVSGLTSCSELTSVTLSPGVQTLGGFSGCSKLEEIHVPDGSQLTTISANAFNGNTKLTSFVFDGSCVADNLTINDGAFSACTGLEEIVLPTNIYKIGTRAFAQSTNLTSVTFKEPSNLTIIGEGAFADTNIQGITIPSTVTTIGDEAFRSCMGLTALDIPAATTNIHPEAFMYCNNLTDINVDENNTVYSSIDGYLLSKDKKTLKIFPPGKANSKFTLLPPSITTIGNSSFYSCKQLTNVTIPNKVTTIGESAFSGCTNLNTITFLCDEMIDPDNISQGTNIDAIEASMFDNITINVRSDKKTEYEAKDYYKQFKAIQTSFHLDDNTAKNEYIATSDNAVDLLSINEGANTYVIPNSIIYGGKTYTVALMGDYACQNAPTTIKEIVMFTNVEYIGAKAFKQTSNQSIQSLFFVQKNPTKQLLSTTRFKLTPADLDGDDQYKEFADNMKLYVRKSAYSTCLTDWDAYKDMIDYKIKDVSISTKYGTFAREFDVDLSECVAENGKQVYAFTAALSKVTEGTGDYGDSEYHISMESINAGKDGDGTYIPKNTGVLLKVMDADATDDNTFYCISDRNDDNLSGYSGNNVMHGVTIDKETITVPTESSIYVMQKGQFRYVNPTKTTTLSMPAHKAYLMLENVSAGAKVSFVYDDDETDSVNIINNDIIHADSPIYNLSGQRVNTSYHGIVVTNGKKIIK